MGCEPDLQVQVAGGGVTNTGRALATQPDALALGYAGGNLHLERALLPDQVAPLVETGDLVADGAGLAAECVLEENRQGQLDVLAAPGEMLARVTLARAVPGLPEHLLEKVGKAALEVAAGGRLESTGLPAGRRLERSRPAGLAQHVVLGPLLGVLEYLIGLGHLLELFLGVALGADIGVEFARQPAIGRLDGLVIGILVHTENFVVILEFHVRVSVVPQKQQRVQA